MTQTEDQRTVSERRWIGKSIRRVEDPRFLTGRGHYVDDIRLPGMLHAATLRSPYAHAWIKSINVEAARKLPGVVAVVTGAEADFDSGTGRLTIYCNSLTFTHFLFMVANTVKVPSNKLDMPPINAGGSFGSKFWA